MTIGTECPHCESVFQVGAELVGKAMRCPNPTCREVFTVEPTGDAAAAPVPIPAPERRPVPVPTPEPTGSVTDFLPLFDAERVNAPTMTFPAIPVPPQVPVVEGERVPGHVYDAEPINVRHAPRQTPAAPIQKAAPLPPTPPVQRAPQVLDWSEVRDRPSPGKPARVDDDSDIPIRTRRRRNPLAVFTLFALVVVFLGVIGGSVYFIVLGGLKSEEQDVAAAEKLYADAKYAEAKRKYDALAADYPDSSAADKYRFFSALSDTRSAISSVTVKEDPAPALRSLTGFVAAHGDSSYAQPNSGYGSDVVVAGQKLCNAIIDHATERVKKFQGDRKKLTLLDDADKAVAEGRALIPTLEKFRDKSGLSFDDVRKKFDDADGAVKKERDRLTALARWRDLAADPTDQRIDDFDKAMRTAGLSKDSEVLDLAASAKTELRRLVEFNPNAVAAGQPPAEIGVTLTAAPRVAGTPEVKFPTGKKDAVFGIARGVLYALDSRTGEKLWAERVADDRRAADSPLRVTFPNGTDDWVLVPSVRGGRAALTARNALTGVAVWQQELPAPVLGKPMRVGSNRLLVPLADPRGTLVELDLDTGNQTGTVELRQPIGGGIAALRGANSGHAFVVVPADARRLFVFEVGRLGDDGKRKPPRVVRVFATLHPRDSLRGAPLVIDPDNAAVPRRVILTQSDGPTEMKLRSFTLPPVAELANPSPEGDTEPPQMAEAAVGGWSWFPPLSDGERVAVCTDTGVFAAFGINQPGQADKPLYQLPGAPPDPTAVSRCQVVWMDDDSFWVVVGGKLTRLRVSADPRGGMKILPTPDSRPVGEPIAAAQVQPANGLAVITTKATDAGTIHLQGFDLASGDMRWTRQLGVLAVAPPFPLADGGWLVVDECGGVYRASTDGNDLDQIEKCEPKPAAVRPAVAAASADGSRVWVAVHLPTPDGVQLSVRTLLNGKIEGDERLVRVPAGLSGNAITVGDHLLFPLANGFIDRLGVKDTEATQGPSWRGQRAKADAICHLSAVADGQFLMSDGDVQLLRRKWAAETQDAAKAGGPWETAGPLSGPAVTIKADKKEWVMAADAFGVAVFDPAKQATTDPVRRWQGAAEGKLPAGAGGKLTVIGERVAWAVGGKAVAVANPANDEPDWVFPLPADAGDVVAVSSSGDGLLVTCSAGVVLELSPTGEVRADAVLPSTGPLTTAGASRVGEQEVLIPHADGTVSRLSLRKR